VSQEQTDALLNELRAFRDDAMQSGDHRMTAGVEHCIAIVENWIASRLERPWRPMEGFPEQTYLLLRCPTSESGYAIAFWSDVGYPGGAWFESEADSHPIADDPVEWMPLPEKTA
jgi:hypothetical protein